MRWFVRGDLDGFFSLALDNLVQVLLIDFLCRSVLGFSNELLYERVLPAVAVSLLLGNLFYAWQARQLAAETGRSDVCALPYGINTPSVFAFVFLVMLPAKIAAEQAGHPDPAQVAWQVGIIACLGSGVIEFLGAFVAERVRQAMPRAALLSTLSGIALGFISMTFLLRTFARPLVGFPVLAIILMTYFGRVRFKGQIPGGVVAVVLGTGIAWAIGIAPTAGLTPGAVSFHPPLPVTESLFGSLTGAQLMGYLSVIIPMGLFNVIGSLQNIESAEAAGDSYRTAPSLAVNGIGTLVAGLFGSCFPTTIYIGHPGWKAIGARAGYSVLNGVFFTIICLTGTVAHIAYAIPVEAAMAIVLYIGIVITAQAFQTTPREHAPAVVMGLLPGVAAWGMLLVRTTLQVAREQGGPDFTEALVPAFQARDVWLDGLAAMEQGFIFTAMLISATVVAIIERRFTLAAAWCAVAAALSALGLMHSYQWTGADVIISLTPAWEWAAGYAVMAAVLLAGRWLTEPTQTGDRMQAPDGEGSTRDESNIA